MGKQRGIGRYRAIDLAMLTGILMIFESIIHVAATRWFPGQPYTVSLAPAIIAIAMARWGAWSAIPAAAGGAVFCLLSRASPAQYAIYILGNLASLGMLPLRNLGMKEKGEFAGSVEAVGFGLGILALIQAGRAVMTMVFGASLPAAMGCFTTEAITDLFTLMLIWTARRMDGVMEDQVHYLQRIRAEQP